MPGVEILFYVLAALLILVGLAGTVVPVLPGVPLMFAGLYLAAWTDRFQHVGWITLTLLGIISVLALLVDFLAGLMGAKRVGASGWALSGAALGTMVGLFFGVVGLVFGPFIGALGGELIAGGSVRQATRVGVGTWIGYLFGTALKLGLSFAMLGIFAFAYVIG